MILTENHPEDFLEYMYGIREGVRTASTAKARWCAIRWLYREMLDEISVDYFKNNKSLAIGITCTDRKCHKLAALSTRAFLGGAEPRQY